MAKVNERAGLRMQQAEHDAGVESLIHGAATDSLLLRDAVEALWEGLERLDSRSPVRRWEQAVRRLLSRATNTLIVAEKAVNACYPAQALILTRSLDEDLITAAYVRLKPTDARFWLATKYARIKQDLTLVQQRRRQLRLLQVARTGTSSPNPSRRRDVPTFQDRYAYVGSRGALRDYQWYRLLSQMAHPTTNSLWLESPIKSAEPHRRYYGARYDPFQSELAYYFLITAAGFALCELGFYVSDQTWIARTGTVIDRIIDLQDRAT